MTNMGMPNDDVMGAAAVSIFASTLLVAYHKLPHVDEALHYYKENDRRLFVVMRTCHIVITTAMLLNMKYMMGWIIHAAWRLLS